MSVFHLHQFLEKRHHLGKISPQVKLRSRGSVLGKDSRDFQICQQTNGGTCKIGGREAREKTYFEFGLLMIGLNYWSKLIDRISSKSIVHRGGMHSVIHLGLIVTHLFIYFFFFSYWTLSFLTFITKLLEKTVFTLFNSSFPLSLDPKILFL